jgi:hypothetical protein
LVVMSGRFRGGEVALARAYRLTRAALAAHRYRTAGPETLWDLVPVFIEIFLCEWVSTAEALRRAGGNDHSGTWQADPAYWAAFQLNGGVR